MTGGRQGSTTTTTTTSSERRLLSPPVFRLVLARGGLSVELRGRDVLEQGRAELEQLVRGEGEGSPFGRRRGEHDGQTNGFRSVLVVCRFQVLAVGWVRKKKKVGRVCAGAGPSVVLLLLRPPGPPAGSRPVRRHGVRPHTRKRRAPPSGQAASDDEMTDPSSSSSSSSEQAPSQVSAQLKSLQGTTYEVRPSLALSLGRRWTVTPPRPIRRRASFQPSRRASDRLREPSPSQSTESVPLLRPSSVVVAHTPALVKNTRPSAA